MLDNRSGTVPASPRGGRGCEGSRGSHGHRSSRPDRPPSSSRHSQPHLQPRLWLARVMRRPRAGPRGGSEGQGRRGNGGESEPEARGRGSTWGAKRPPLPSHPSLRDKTKVGGQWGSAGTFSPAEPPDFTAQLPVEPEPLASPSQRGRPNCPLSDGPEGRPSSHRGSGCRPLGQPGSS